MNTDELTVREAARRRIPLDGANAQALEGALSMTERERDAARAEAERLRAECERLERNTRLAMAICRRVQAERDKLQTKIERLRRRAAHHNP